MFKKFLAVAIVACLAAPASAGVMASSFIEVSNFTVSVSGPGTFSPAGGPASVSVESLAGADSDTIIGNGFGPFNVNASQGPATSMSSASGSGSILVPPGASFLTSAMVDAPDGSGSVDPLSAFSTSTLAASFSVTGQPVTVNVAFDALLELELLDTGVPMKLNPFATSALTLTLIGTSPGAVVPPAFAAKVAAINAQFTKTVSLGSPGAFSDTEMDSFDESVVLAPGSYGFILSQTSTAGATLVPEPASGAAFAVIGVVGCLTRRRRRKN